MKKLYSLFAFGALLFAACSENASSISGSTSVPNMGNNLTPESPVLCSTIGVTDSLEAIEKGCIWSPEMWSRTSGYRVRTGYDNGTNTSGIWIWHAEPGTYDNVRFEWPGIATAEYDSMALADVIDKCGGSLCGKIVYEPDENEIDSEDGSVAPSAYVEFYFAGKDSLGNIEEVDVSAMKGICVEFSGSLANLQLLPNDSIADLNKFSSYSLSTLAFRAQDGGFLSESKEVCFPWSQFTMNSSSRGNHNQKMPEIVYVPIGDVVAHLKGVRFIISFSETKTDFNIISIGRYHLADIPMTNLHPVDETCEPIAVTSTFCDCEYSEEKALSVITHTNYMDFAKKKYKAENDSVPLSNSSNKCLKRILDSLVVLNVEKKRDDVSRPCDNPQPLKFACADGTESESIEFAEKQEEFGKVIESLSEGMIPADSLFAHCLSLSD